MNKIDFKKDILPVLAIIALFFVISIAYNTPVLEGKVVNAGDQVNAVSNQQEIVRYFNEEGKSTWWSNSIFSGMPVYQIYGAKTAASTALAPFYKFSRIGFTNPIFTILFYLISFFILLRVFNVKRSVAVVGAIAIAFSSYFLIIIGAGHGGKTAAITWMTLVFAGMLLCYQKRYGLGAILSIVGMSCGYTIHPQMAYYILMLVGVMFCVELYIAIKNKKIKEWVIASLIFVVSVGIGFGTKLTDTFANAEYMTETMRGGHSDLVSDEEAGSQSKGLDIAYATQWSYGIDETLTFLIPNFKGGSSNYNVGKDSHLYKGMIQKGVAPQSALSIAEGAPMYWGDQPFTSGPVYMGAIICFLFVLGLLIVKGPYKWGLLIVTIFSVALSWGNNFLPLTELFFKFFPLYNKFRAVSSILIVAEITIPLLAILAVKEIYEGNISKEKFNKSLLLSLTVTGGLSLLVAILGKSTFSFSGMADASIGSLPDWLYSLIVEQRQEMLVTDAWRSFLFVALGAGIIWLLANKKMKEVYLISALGVLVLVDMWQVDKRYFNDSNFSYPRSFNQVFAMQPYEEEILKDKDPHFRVMNATVNAFSESRTSYYLKSIGGYHAAKLRRYQDLIDVHLNKGNMPVVNMLNTKYVIMDDEKGNINPVRNYQAFGNAWFVNEIFRVNNPNDEINNLTIVDIAHKAIVDETLFGDFITPPADQSQSYVKLTSYAPDVLEYDVHAQNGGTIVFSEIYYPYGWKAYIDDELVDHFRANYVLRALNVPQGDHVVRFEFRPDSIKKGTTLALIFISMMYLVIIGGIVMWVRKRFFVKES